ncbi:hypothetical protein WDW37_10640 [Bdellovibrionota bacterium FG-1]
MRAIKLNLFSDEQGQATTEYILMLAIAVGLFVIVMRMLKPIMVRLQKAIATRLQNMLFGDFHRFRIGR